MSDIDLVVTMQHFYRGYRVRGHKSELASDYDQICFYDKMGKLLGSPVSGKQCYEDIKAYDDTLTRRNIARRKNFQYTEDVGDVLCENGLTRLTSFHWQ